MIQFNKILCFLLITLFFSHLTESLDLESAREGKQCSDVPKMKPSFDWFFSVPNWYHIAGSRLDLYSVVRDYKIITGRNESVREDEIYYNICPVLKTALLDNKISLSKVFQNVDLKFKVKPLDDDLIHIEYFRINKDETEHFWGTSQLSWTDNKSFIFQVNCVHDFKEQTWVALSPFKSLPKETLKALFDHAEWLGFKRNQFTLIRQDYCNQDV